ncbi:HCL668Cp [Eremothecium sinecaudum]|uniref:HCL668Cp n=1 Tax=Eremothecium sinecaudum TaxID=45286 RepID=A0A109UXS4_9SACH|nr:HCL668Cp [Eremothecium sinecaudum]AMD19483.1 HCL668Cp [Eremothecium sinecaudum]
MLPDNLQDLIHAKYEAAQAKRAIEFTKTTTSKLKDPESGLKYVVSFAEHLQKKPERGDKALEKVDPFANVEPDLTVLESVNDDYRLVLNRYPVTPEHILLITKDFKPQTSALSPKDLMTGYKLLDKLDDDEQRFMLFYNCGANSGSSVDHKHLQLMRMPEKFTAFQDMLCKGEQHFIPGPQKEPLQDKRVSFSHYVLPLPEEAVKVTEDLLAMSYVAVLQRALTHFQNWAADKPDLETAYNFIMTKQWICIVPRSKPASEEYRIGFNSTAYLGLVLVKWEDTLKKITESPQILAKVLMECSFPNTAGEKSTEYNY